MLLRRRRLPPFWHPPLRSTPLLRVLQAIRWSASPIGLDMLAAQTVLSRDEVALALFELLHQGHIIQVTPGLPERSVWRGLYAPAPTP